MLSLIVSFALHLWSWWGLRFGLHWSTSCVSPRLPLRHQQARHGELPPHPSLREHVRVGDGDLRIGVDFAAATTTRLLALVHVTTLETVAPSWGVLIMSKLHFNCCFSFFFFRCDAALNWFSHRIFLAAASFSSYELWFPTPASSASSSSSGFSTMVTSMCCQGDCFSSSPGGYFASLISVYSLQSWHAPFSFPYLSHAHLLWNGNFFFCLMPSCFSASLCFPISPTGIFLFFNAYSFYFFAHSSTMPL